MLTELQFSLKVLESAGLLKMQLLADYLNMTPQHILSNAWGNGAEPSDVVKDAEMFYSTQVH